MNMRQLFLSVAAMLAFTCAFAQNMTMGEGIPRAAVEVLQPRLVQMLQGGGAADVPLQVEARVAKRLETPGSMSQVALEIELTLRSGEAAETFLLKGVGEDEADAWVRAMKQFLPRGKAAQGFVARVKP